MIGLPFWLALSGCPWVSPALHRDNQARLDRDADADTDTDTDETGHTGQGCVEDADEPNDTLATATLVGLPAALAPSSCDGDADYFTAAVPEFSVFSADLACEGEAVVRVYRDGVLWATEPSGCPSVTRLGLGQGTYTVGITTPAGTDLAYTLDLEAVECLIDGDLDGQPSEACPGGSDCDDGNNTIYVGAPDDPASPADEDCDGANDLAADLPQDCLAAVNGFPVTVPELPCGAPDLDPVWHHLTFPVDAGDRVEIFLTPVGGPADLFALYTDADGRYGLDPGEDELDAEARCASAGYGDCPSACLTATGGTAHLWMAQRDCSGPATFQALLSVNGVQPAVTVEAAVAGPRR
jgi:hypothetical protein